MLACTKQPYTESPLTSSFLVNPQYQRHVPHSLAILQVTSISFPPFTLFPRKLYILYSQFYILITPLFDCIDVRQPNDTFLKYEIICSTFHTQIASVLDNMTITWTE